MAELKYVTSQRLRQYYELDNELERQLSNDIAACFVPNPIIDLQALSDCRLVIHGIWVYVRVMQGLNLQPENLSFVKQDNTEEGRRGQDFWLKIGGQIDLGVIDNQSGKFAQIALVTAFPPIAPLLVIFNAFDSIFNSDASKKRKLDNLKGALAEYLNWFNDFLKEWEKEDRLQNPEKYAKTNPIGKTQTPAPFTAKANGDGTITVQGITSGDIVSIDGVAQIAATSNTFTTTAQKDGEHKVTVSGEGLFYYIETVNVTTKVTLLSAPLTYIQNNATSVGITIFILIVLYVFWKRGVF